MSGNLYRAATPRGVSIYGDDELELTLTADEERDALRDGHLVQVARPYRVISSRFTVKGAPVWRGAVIEAAFPVEIEAALIAGGHIERSRRDAKPTFPPPDPEAEADTAEDTDPQPRRKRTEPKE